LKQEGDIADVFGRFLGKHSSDSVPARMSRHPYRIAILVLDQLH
jgi:hypothetical protein